MPGVFQLPMSRKQFLGASAALSCAALTSQQRLVGDDNAQRTRVALLSDTHIPANATDEYRDFRPVDNLRLVVEQVVAASGEAAIINGDAARLTGQLADYEALKSLLRPVASEMPIHIGLGNHDDRGNFFEVFPQADEQPGLVAGKHVSVFELGGTQFVVLDSLLYVDKVAGLLGKLQRDWLANFLHSTSDQPIVFFVHHSLGDGDGDLLDFERVFELMRPHQNVKAIFYGHSHRYHIEQRDHIYLINQPAVAYNFSDEQPVGWLDATFHPQGVDLRLHAIGGNQSSDGQVSEVRWS